MMAAVLVVVPAVDVSAKRIRRTMPVVMGRPVAMDEVVSGEADADVKMELTVSTPSP